MNGVYYILYVCIITNRQSQRSLSFGISWNKKHAWALHSPSYVLQKRYNNNRDHGIAIWVDDHKPNLDGKKPGTQPWAESSYGVKKEKKGFVKPIINFHFRAPIKAITTKATFAKKNPI